MILKNANIMMTTIEKKYSKKKTKCDVGKRDKRQSRQKLPLQLRVRGLTLYQEI
jgi:hypothetical protein